MHRKILLVVLVLASLAAQLGLGAFPAGAQAGDEELRRAAEELEHARIEAGAAGQELAAGRAEAARLRAELEQLADEVAGAEVRFAAARGDARERAGAMYMAAGGRGGDMLGAEAAVRRTYAAAVAARDQEVVNALAAAAADLNRWRRALRDRAQEQGAVAGRLEEAAAAAGQVLAEAEAEYSRARAAWEVQEAERRAAAAAAARTTTTTGTPPGEPGATTTTTGATTTTTTTASTSTTVSTTTTVATSTTTLPPPTQGGTFPPLVERWRPLVTVYFPAELVDQALSVIRCESLGDPAIVNPVSGAAGLFQHMPRYWPERAAAAGFPGASPFDPEANIAGAAWLVRVSLEDGLPAWYFWSCQP